MWNSLSLSINKFEFQSEQGWNYKKTIFHTNLIEFKIEGLIKKIKLREGSTIYDVRIIYIYIFENTNGKKVEVLKK